MVSFFALTMRICLIRQVVVCKHKKVHENEKGEMKNAAEQKRKSDLQCNDVFYHGALDEHLQRNTSYGSVKPHNDPRGLDRIPDRLCVRDVPCVLG